MSFSVYVNTFILGGINSSTDPVLLSIAAFIITINLLVAEPPNQENVNAKLTNMSR